eukprot:6190650-Pleurochrysis_carterae.AAC.3
METQMQAEGCANEYRRWLREDRMGAAVFYSVGRRSAFAPRLAGWLVMPVDSVVACLSQVRSCDATSRRAAHCKLAFDHG